MTAPLFATIRRTARRVRRACERLAPDLGYCSETLALFCPFAAEAMTAELLGAGLDARLVVGHFRVDAAGGEVAFIGHFWSEVLPTSAWRDAIVVDITLKQFDPEAPKVAVLPPEDPRAGCYFMHATDERARRNMLLPDRDIMRVLPERWWTRLDDSEAMLDARVLAVLRRQPRISATASIARQVRATPKEVREAMARLAHRSPLPQRSAA